MQIGSDCTITCLFERSSNCILSFLHALKNWVVFVLFILSGYNALAVKTYKLNTLSDSVVLVSATSTSPDRFYDDGGLSSKYSNSISNRSYTFHAPVGNYVRIRFYACDIKNGDYLTFYDGQQTTARVIGESTYNGNGGFMVVSTTGSLTVTFYSNFAANGNGWDADVWVSSNPGQTWLGGTSTNVNTTGNWEGNSLPTQWSSVFIPSGTTFSPDIANSRSLTCYDLSVRSGATLTFSGSTSSTCRIFGDVSCDGRINHSGSLYVNLMGGLSTRFASISGSGNLTNVSFAIGNSGQAFYKLLNTLQINELVLSSTSGQSEFDMNDYDLKTYFIEIQSSVKFYQRSGALYIEESAAIINDVSFYEQTGTTYFSSGTLFVAQNQTIPAISYYHLTIQGGATKSLAGSIDVNGNLNVVSGTLSPGSSTITLAGNFANTSIFNSGTSTLTLDGGYQQRITSGGTSFYNVTINNTGTGILLNDQLRLTNLCTFNDGIVSSSTSAPMVFANSASCTSQSDASHVNGLVKKETSSMAAFIFPVGNGLNYRPASITPSSSISCVWQVTYNATGYVGQLVKTSLQKISSLEYWDIERTGSVNALIGLSYGVSSLTNLTTDVTKLVASHFDGVESKWEAAGSSGGASNPISGWVYTNAAWSSFSPFTLGTVLSSNAALPIVLVDYAIDCEFSGSLKWTTYSEMNTQYFEVYASNDGADWQLFEQIAATGKSNSTTNYALPLSSSFNYFKLYSADTDGNKTEYSILQNNCFGSEQISIFPNPATTNIRLTFINDESFSKHEIQVYDLFGKNILNDTFEGVQHILNVEALKPGGYVLYLDQNQRFKFIKN